ncbi:hypothetical protein L195_g014382, partial [Trifolium pratense]
RVWWRKDEDEDWCVAADGKQRLVWLVMEDLLFFSSWSIGGGDGGVR